MSKPKLVVFASGTKDKETGLETGGSGFENLVNASRNGILDADIVAVVSSRAEGKVKERAERLGIPFIYFNPPARAEEGDTEKEGEIVALYQEVVKKTGAEFVALSGWLKMAYGLNPQKSFNIHPGPVPQFGGKGMYGHFVHEAVVEAFKKGEVTQSAVTMHFVIPGYDRGPVFFAQPVEILATDTADDLAARVNAAEHIWQPVLTNQVLKGEIFWDGTDFASLKSPYIK